ncbi:hypothetical protein RHSIM_RhsimMtG0000500 (mitochondrion) [Rhododendron simsii]|uniref:Uncharacterized protein n=1 Tax=Rhododendron simsii TaxID=118357 RepID=A0A834FXM6_RHOSS|nr:hypothetical protein RHSIM_RhsimMtG0000500 [Rhododendron simsii]
MESWLLDSQFIETDDIDFLMEFSTFTTEKRIDSLFLSLTHIDHFTNNASGFEMLEQPGASYLRYLVDIQRKSLMNYVKYDFNTSCLAERRISLAHYETIIYSKTLCGANRFDLPSLEKTKTLLAPLSLIPIYGYFCDRLFVNTLQGPKDFFYDDSIDEETEDIDAEIPYVDPAEGASQIVKSNDLADPKALFEDSIGIRPKMDINQSWTGFSFIIEVP